MERFIAVTEVVDTRKLNNLKSSMERFIAA